MKILKTANANVERCSRRRQSKKLCCVASAAKNAALNIKNVVKLRPATPRASSTLAGDIKGGDNEEDRKQHGRDDFNILIIMLNIAFSFFPSFTPHETKTGQFTAATSLNHEECSI